MHYKCIKALPKYVARHETKGAALFNILIGALDFTDADQAATDISLLHSTARGLPIVMGPDPF